MLGFGGSLVLHLNKVLPVLFSFLFGIDLFIVFGTDFIRNLIFHKTHMALGNDTKGGQMSLQRHRADFKLFRQLMNTNQVSSSQSYSLK
jgi:hypothetical protein